MNRTAGFSLIELVVVMVITAILAAVAIPRLTDSETKGSWYYEQVKAGVRYAQRQAVAQRRLIYVLVLPGQISLCYASPCAGTELTQMANGLPYILLAPAGTNITVVAGAVPFSFNGLGQPSGGAVQLKVAGTVITVNAETGYVQ